MSSLSKIYDISAEERRKMGLNGRKHVENNYGFENFQNTWVRFMDKVHAEEGSWDNRKGYYGIRFKEIA